MTTEIREQPVDGESDRASESVDDYVPAECLSFTVSANSAHFRKIEGTSTAQTYKVPPRTTLMGLVAAVIGDDYDSYYARSLRSNSALAVVPETELRTQRLAVSEVGTANKEMRKEGPKVGRKKALRLPKMGNDRHAQRNPYVYLRNVAYRVFVAFDRDTDEGERAYTELRDRLATGESVYPPVLGRTDCLASIEYHGECRVEATDADCIDSAIPGDDAIGSIITPTVGPSGIDMGGGMIETERSAAEFERVEDDNGQIGRRPLSWETWTVRRDGKPIGLATDRDVYTVGPDDDGENYTVMFS